MTLQQHKGDYNGRLFFFWSNIALKVLASWGQKHACVCVFVFVFN